MKIRKLWVKTVILIENQQCGNNNRYDNYASAAVIGIVKYLEKGNNQHGEKPY